VVVPPSPLIAPYGVLMTQLPSQCAGQGTAQRMAIGCCGFAILVWCCTSSAPRTQQTPHIPVVVWVIDRIPDFFRLSKLVFAG
jgi:hypothetical protein